MENIDIIIDSQTSIESAERTVEMVSDDIETLELRYLLFCEKHDLETELQADEQYDLSQSQQNWIDRHLDSLAQLNIELMALQAIESDKPESDETAETIKATEAKGSQSAFELNVEDIPSIELDDMVMQKNFKVHEEQMPLSF